MLAEEFQKQAAEGEFDDEVDEFMETFVSAWQGNAPSDTGEYRDSIQVTQKAHGGKGQVGSTDEAASFIEYGTSKTPEHASLRRTIEQLSGPNH